MTDKTPRTAASKRTPRKESTAFTAEERAAMQERASELKKESGRAAGARADGAAEVLAKIAELAEPDRDLATRLHALIMTCAPDLSPRLWYGMPAYARGGKVVCFFQGVQKFKTRYATLGFSDEAKLDDGALWPTAFALTSWTPETEAQIGALVQRALG